MLLYTENFDSQDFFELQRKGWTGSGSFVEGMGESFALDIGTQTVTFPVQNSRRIVLGAWISMLETSYEGSASIKFGHGETNYFSINLSIERAYYPLISGHWDTNGDRFRFLVSFSQEGTTGASSEYVSINDTSCFHLYEFVLDLQDGFAGNGYFAMYVDGVQVLEKTPVVTDFITNPNGEDAFLNTITFCGVNVFKIDSLYVLNEEMGALDEPLGAFQVSRLLPSENGTRAQWTPTSSGDSIEATDHAAFVRHPYFTPGDPPALQLESTMDGTKDSFFFENNIDYFQDDLELFALSFNLWHRKGLITTETPFKLIPFAALTGREFSYAYSNKALVDDMIFEPLRVNYSVTPGLSEFWTWELLELSQFGFVNSLQTISKRNEESMSLAENVTVE